MSFSTFYFGDWQVEPSANSLRLGSQVKQLEPKAMDVLFFLCEREGDVVSTEEIVNHCWPDMFMGDNPLHKVINQLRRALGDSATSPQYIETIRKRGYRTLAKISYPKGHTAVAESQLWQSGSPFPGLQAYSAEHADVFFGRSEQVSTLLNRISLQVKYGRAFCLILGPSGSGKTSLINAGVMPNLMSNKGYNGIEVVSYSDIDLADIVDNPPVLNVASAMLDWEYQDKPIFDGYSADTLAQALIETPAKVVDCCKSALKGHGAQHAFFTLFVDRLEVVLSSPLFTQTQRQQLFDVIECLAQSGHILILAACRNDFYPDLVQYPNLMSGKSRGAHFDLCAPTRPELLQMIRLPAVAAKLTWQSDSETAMPLDEMLCADAASNPDALPMLQYTLQALYLNRDENNQLLISEYQNLGRLEGAIGKNAEEVLERLGEAEKEAVPKILSLLVTLKEDDKSITSRTARWSQLSTEAERNLVKAMVDSRLFVSHLQYDTACFSIAHEALLRRWPRATLWIDDHGESLGIKSRLLNQSRRWLAESQTPDYLLAQGKPLSEAQQLSHNPLFTLEPEELALIKASAKRASVRLWRRRITTGVLVALTMLSVLMSVRSIEAEQRALEKRLAAENLLGFMVGDFADKLRGIGRMDLLDGISNKALEYFSEASDINDANNYSFDAHFQHAQTIEAMGEVAYSRGKIDEATTAFLSAKTKLEALLTEQPDNLELLKTLGANAFWLGQIQYDAKNWLATKPYFEAYLQYSQTMYRVFPEDDQAAMEASYAFNSLGSIAMKLKNFNVATEFFKKSLDLKLLVLNRAGTNDSLMADIADTRSWLANSELSRGDLMASMSIHKTIQAEYSLLSDSISNNAYLAENLALSYHNASILYKYKGELGLAIDSALKADDLFQRILKLDQKNELWRQRYFILKLHFLELGEPLFEQGMIDAEKLILDLTTEESLMGNNVRQTQLKARLKSTLAKFYLGKNKLAITQAYIQQGRVLGDSLVSQFPEVKEYLWLKGVVSMVEAEMYSQKGESTLMIASCKSAEKALIELQQIDKDPKYVIPYAESLRCQGKLATNFQLTTFLSTSGIKPQFFITEDVKK